MARPKNITVSFKTTLNRKTRLWSCYWQDSKTGRAIRRGCNAATTKAQANAMALERYNEWSKPAPKVSLGFEHALSNNFSLRLEYSHIDLGQEEHFGFADLDVKIDTIRLGVNYKFN